MNKINSIKGNIWTNNEGATAENTFIEVANTNVKYGLPGDGSGDSFDGINKFNSKDSNIYYGQLVDKNSIVKINADKMRAFFNKYYTEEQLEVSMGSSEYFQLFYLSFKSLEKTYNEYNPYKGKFDIYFDNASVFTYMEEPYYYNNIPIIDSNSKPAKEVLESFPDIEIPFNDIFSSEEIAALTIFSLGKLDGTYGGEFVDFNERPVDWIEIVQNTEEA